MRRKNTLGFTLAELITTITILTILSVLALVGYSFYLKQARDSTRVSDIKNISTSLEVYKVQYGHFPDPYNYFNVTQSWVLLWKQGTIGDNFWQIGTMAEKPVDPLFQTEYVYSVNFDNSIYELGGLSETNIE